MWVIVAIGLTVAVWQYRMADSCSRALCPPDQSPVMVRVNGIPACVCAHIPRAVW